MVGAEAAAVQMGLFEDAGFVSSSCRVVCIRLAVRPISVAQESGLECGVEGEEGLDQLGLWF